MANKIIPPLDLMFFLTESPQSPKHVGAVQIFQLPAGAPSNYLLDLVATFREAPVVAPFNYYPHFPRLGLPQWREVQDMEMSYHVRHSALPGPGTEDQLMEVVQRLHAGLLDRRRPCWICQVIEGLEGNRFAIYSKIHHAYIDGMSGVKRMYGSLSSSPTDTRVIPSWSFEPDQTRDHRRTGRPQRAGNNTAQQLVNQAKGMAQAYGFLADMGLQWLKLRDGKAAIPFSAGRTRMNRTVEWETRSTAVCSFELDDIKAIGHKQGCTVNEVVLAIIGAALNDYLAEHHEKPGEPLVALCPVSLRSQEDHSAKTQVAAVNVRLGEPDAALAQRLEQVVESSRAAKDAVSGLSSEALMDYGVVIFALWELLSRTRLDQFVTPSYNVLVSNVPGPGNDTMYLCGSKMLASYPISTLLPGVNLNATVVSHGNSLDFGLLGDKHILPDLDLVAQRMLHHFETLRGEVLGSKPAAAKASGKRANAGRKATPKPRGKAAAKPARKSRAKTAAKPARASNKGK
jgi:WS/DGAT/MGAT family acyltransferase